jgi:hypothetical protein
MCSKDAPTMVMFLSYALAMWYGSILVADHGASSGSVISVIFAVLTGGSLVAIHPIHHMCKERDANNHSVELSILYNCMLYMSFR